MNRIVNKLLILISVFYSATSFGTTEVTNHVCRSNANAVPGTSSLIATFSDIKPFYSVDVGAVLGTATLEGRIICNSGTIPEDRTFSLQFHSAKKVGGDVCETNIKGVGVRIIGKNGPIPCGGQGELFSIAAPVKNISYKINLPNAIELVRTHEQGSPAWVAHVAYLANLDIYSSWSGLTEPSLWGKPRANINTPPIVIAANCVFAQTMQTVTFDKVTPAQISSGSIVRPFDVTFKNCETTLDALFFGNIAKIRFVSPHIRVDGTLENQCDGCAQGVAIEISNSAGKIIDLNQVYSLKYKPSTLSDTTIIYHFNAKLHQIGEIKPGKIHAILTMEITSV